MVVKKTKQKKTMKTIFSCGFFLTKKKRKTFSLWKKIFSNKKKKTFSGWKRFIIALRDRSTIS